MEAEFKKAVNLFEIDKIKQAKKICIKIYKKNPKHFDNLRLLNFIYFKVIVTNKHILWVIMY